MSYTSLVCHLGKPEVPYCCDKCKLDLQLPNLLQIKWLHSAAAVSMRYVYMCTKLVSACPSCRLLRLLLVTGTTSLSPQAEPAPIIVCMRIDMIILPLTIWKPKNMPWPSGSI